MRVFLGSSRESIAVMHDLARWLEDVGHSTLLWDDPRTFRPGDYTLTRLLEIARSVDAAVLVLGEDDRVWYRNDTVAQPRDNVLLEYGIFASALGQKRAIICRVGQSKTPTDLNGLTYLAFRDAATTRAMQALQEWAAALPAFTEADALQGRWLKIGPLGWHFVVKCHADGTLTEHSIVDSTQTWQGTRTLVGGSLRMEIGGWRLDISPSHSGSIYRGSEVHRSNPPTHHMFTVIHIPFVKE